MIIIADSGSTKVDFRIIDDSGKVRKAACSGLNPVYVSSQVIQDSLKEQVLPLSGKKVDAIYFYGAGVIGETADKVRGAFTEVFDYDLIYVESDMLGAARALFGDKAGIACILGTGSNSCCYDGRKIVQNVRSGGFILGDEAGGADLGKRLLKAYIKGLMPASLEQEFQERYNLDYAAIVRHVYREPEPGRFLGSFSPFIEEHLDDPFIVNLLVDAFNDFLRVNVMQYDYGHLEVSFIGSVASVYRDILTKCLDDAGLQLGTIMRSPIDALVQYHTRRRQQEARTSGELMEKAVALVMARTGISDREQARQLLLKFGSVAKAVENYK
ncbi:MAG: ATPase [Bacteroidales bacterium]|nr:ATPase [Bacteroidales bacterium]MBO7487043.1 ATPase [Bacteroidales bacterium]